VKLVKNELFDSKGGIKPKATATSKSCPRGSCFDPWLQGVALPGILFREDWA
jgi:hypothetical protein